MGKKVLIEDEIRDIKALKEQFKKLTEIIGETEVQIMNLKLRKEQLKINFQKIQQEEATLAKKLEDKYGEGNINLETGEFTLTK